MLKLSERYPQKRALITGAASGIGEALSMQLAADHWQIGLCDTNAAALKGAVTKIEAAGGSASSYSFDVRDRDAYYRAVEDFVHRAGGIDLVVNNAGIAAGGAMGDMTLEDWDTTISINLMGVINGLHFTVPQLKMQRAGHIINTASASALFPMPNMAAYSASKAAVLAISETLYTELGPFGVGVSCLLPSYVRTNLSKTSVGTPESVAFANKLITRSKYSAQELAEYTLEQAGRRALFIIFPAEARRMWYVKRLLPHRYFKSVQKYAPSAPPKDAA